MTATCIAAMLFTLSHAPQGQAPTPFLPGPIESGATVIEGRYDPLERGVAPDLKLLATEGAEGEFRLVHAEFSVNLVRGIFTATLKTALKHPQKVKVRLRIGSTDAESLPVAVSEAPGSTELTLTGVEAIYGAAKVTVFFDAESKVVGQPMVRVTYNESTVSARLTEDQLKAGRTEIALPAALVADSGPPPVTVTAEPGGKKMTVSPNVAAVQVDLPLREGDTTITGSAHSTVQRVCVAVLGGAVGVGDAPRLDDRLKTPARNCHESLRVSQLVNASALVAITRVKATTPPPTENVKTALKAMSPLQSLDDKQLTLLASRESGELRDSLFDLSGLLIAEMEVAVDERSHKFKFDLPRPLDAGSKVLIREVFPNPRGAGPEVALAGPDPVIVDSAGVDLGRVRAFFTAGGAVSQSSNSFGKAEPYLAFSADGSVWNYLVTKGGSPRAGAEKDGNQFLRDLFNDAPLGFSLHLAAGARLTQTGTVTAIGAAPSGLQAAQSTVLFGGLYLPVRGRGMDWVHRGIQYSSFLAPLAKAGVTALKDGVLLSRTTTSTAIKIEPCPIADCSAFTKTTASDPKLAFGRGTATFYGFGFRAGVMKYTVVGNSLRNHQVAPDPIMYVDVTWGEDKAFVTPGPIATTQQADVNARLGTTTETTTKVQSFAFGRRLAVEARLKIPYLPAEIGADLNFNKSEPLTALAGSDSTGNYTDFRFIVGIRLDVAKALATVLGRK